MAAAGNNQIHQYKSGHRVEVEIPEPGFEASFFSAIVKHRIPRYHQVKVEFRTLVEGSETGDEREPLKPLRMVVPVAKIRPMPLQLVVSDFATGDVDDAYVRDGWWTGTVHEKTGVALFDVYFPTTGEILPVPFADLRVHMRYNHLQQEWSFNQRRMQ